MLCLPKKFHNAAHVGIHSQSSQVSAIDYTKQVSLLRYIWNLPTPRLTRYEALMKHVFLPFELKGYFPKKLWCRIGTKLKHQHFASHQSLHTILWPGRWQPKTTVSALFGLSSMASQRAPFNKSSPTFELSLQSFYDIHLIPKWRPINYSFVCMFISPFASFWLQNSFV